MDEQSRESLGAEIQNAEDVKKLETFTKELENTDNNVLTHLCSGLQTFLGFDPTSKGYDGSGIVYSDLDRLCDGVMGFLYQVLKDVSEKQPYSVGKRELNDALEMLQNNLSTGRKGFEVIEQVAQRVRGYNKFVKKQNDDVKNKITDLDTQMKKLKQSVSEDLKHNSAAGAGRIVQGSVDSAEQLVERCLNNANKFNESLDTENDENVRNAINDLNSIVRDNVNKARACVKLETEQFTALSSKQQEHMRVMKDKIERCLTDLGTCVNDNIKKKVAKLVEDLSKKVSEIKRQLEDIKKKLIEYIRELTTWIEKAQPLINSAFGKVEEILKEVTEGNSDKKPFIINAAVREITASVLILHGAGDDAKKQVTDKVTAALQQVKEMNDELKKDLYTVKQAIKEAITALGETLKKNVNQDLGALELGVNEEMQGYIKSLRQHINKRVYRIIHGKGNTQKGLQGVQTLVKNYAKKFTKQHFQKDVLDGWIDDILLNAGGPLESLIDAYVQTNLNPKYFVIKDQSEAKTKVIRNIKTILDQELKAVVTNVDEGQSSQGNNVALSLTKIKDFIVSFLSQMRKNMQTSGHKISDVWPKIVAQIEQDNELVSKVKQTQHDNTLLKSAAQRILPQLISRAHQAITELEWLIGDKAKVGIYDKSSIATEIDEAKTTAEGLEQNLARKTSEDKGTDDKTTIDQQIAEKLGLKFPSNGAARLGVHASGPNNYNLGKQHNLMPAFYDTYEKLHAGTLNNIRGQGNVLDEEIGGDIMTTDVGGGANKISDIDKNKFTNYDAQVKQDSVAEAVSDPNNLKGALPQKITDIKTQVEQALKKIDGEKQYAQQKIGEITSSLQQLCQAVKAAGDTAQGSLKELQDTYFNTSPYANGGIRIIKYKLTNLQEDDLRKAIEEATKFLDEAAKIREQTVGSLKIDVDGQVKEVKRQLTSELEKHYITTMALQLDHFADRVTEHLKGLPEAIENDKHTGFKGFMEAFEGKPEVKPRDKYAFEAPKGEQSRLEAFKGAVTEKQASKKDQFKTLSEEFKKWYIHLHLYVNKETVRVNDEENSKKHPAGTEIHDYQRRLLAMYDRFNELMSHITNANRYDHQIPGLLDRLLEAVYDLKPDGFAQPSTPVIDSVSSGLTNFVGELRNVYISAYDRQTFEGLLCTEETKTDDAGQTKKLTHLTDHGKKCAKVFLTLLCTLMSSLTILKHNCKSLTKQQINKSTDVGRQFAELGFTVSDDGKQNGELHDTSVITGEYIANSLTFRIKEANNIEHLKTCQRNEDRLTNNVSIFDILKCIYHHFEEYNEVCHIASSSSKSPCSVYEMLVWLTGLPYTAANSVMRHATITELFENPDKQVTDGEISGTLVGDSPINARPYDITFDRVIRAIDHVCSKSYGILTTVAGHGDADTTYGSDLCNNSLKLKYPSSGEDCFQMLLDVLWRLLPALRYLQTQCVLNDKYSGWANCQYGKGVPPSNWPCSDHPSDEAKCQANCQANDKPTCRPTSPLQSYLHDCLVGHLPHRVTSIGCRSVCSNCPRNKPGMPCLTPMGFRGFSGSAKTGKDIYEMINTFFGTGLISSVLCLVPKPPSTLAEHFSFASSLVKDWQYSGSIKENDFQSCIETSIEKLSIRLNESRSAFTDTLRDVYGSSSSSHSAQSHVAAYTDLASLSRNATCSGLDVQCGPYLQSTCHDAYNYLAHKHTDTYLSWALYLPWAFWNYLKSLLDAFQQIDCGSFGCRGCPCKPGSHGKEADCKCNTIVRCRGVAPTFYSYGFTLGDAQALMRTDSVKNCANFVTQLKALLNSNYFKTLFEKCDEFIFTIRQPFIWLNVALWSLSLFYLICVMVGRLDVLHIRSHLRTPSSHKITAQSLLAAAQVGRLAKISYLQP